MRRPAKHSRLVRNVEALHEFRCDRFNSAKMFDRPPRPSKNLRGPCWAPEAFARCWFGAMSYCHGARGLAGQYKFGGRSGGCVALLGVAKLVLRLVLGRSLVKILDQFSVCVFRSSSVV
ncbi:Molybdate transporter 1 [Abeliophyllum distichum]|uniref:Molybdate transporter 1 n=1 Tax=Abeliophyllum distichum TaxID=126358 RepID=A0ABD1U3W9_9LAMI